MAFRDRLAKRKVYVDEKPVVIDANAMPEDILEAVRKNPQNYSLVTVDQAGNNQLVPSGQRIAPEDGQRFETNLTGYGG